MNLLCLAANTPMLSHITHERAWSAHKHRRARHGVLQPPPRAERLVHDHAVSTIGGVAAAVTPKAGEDVSASGWPHLLGLVVRFDAY